MNNKILGLQAVRAGSRQAQPTASIQFHTPPGIGWRLHMSKIAAEIRTVLPVRAPLCRG
jgi:hypothetical protein